MLIKASAALRNDYASISALAKETKEPIYITKNGEGDLVLMSIDAFEKREQMLQLRASVLQAEQERIDGEPTISVSEARKRLRERASEDLKKIEDYYILQFDVQTALKVSDHILDTIERLEQFPDSGSATPDDWLNEQGYRMVICKKHIAIYRVIHEIVYVYHIADTQTDYTKLFYQ